MTLRRAAGIFCLALLIAAASDPAHGQPLDLSGGGPVEITARSGFEWREAEQLVIAAGDARAVRGTVTVLADRLIARYRKRAAGAPAAVGGRTDAGGNEIYRLEAEGHVRIFTATDEAVGDRAVYDMDQAVLVMTGRVLRLTTPQQVLTARDSLEYWAQRSMAVARGNAVVLTPDARRLAADVLVAHIDSDPPGGPAAAQQAQVARPPPRPVPGGDPQTGKLKRVEAYGNVEARTETDIVRGDRGVYVPQTGLARLLGNVRVTHGLNQLNGPAADVNMRTGVARITADPGARVQGMIVPENTRDPARGGQSPARQGGVAR